VTVGGAELVELPGDSESLKAVVRSLVLERDREKQRAEQLRVEILRLQLELERYKKRYYGQVEYFPGHFERIHHVRKTYACPVHPDDVPPATEVSPGCRSTP
jgi:hypothetical protein